MRFVVQGARKVISFGFAHRPRVATFGEEAHVAARTWIPDVGDGVTNAAVIEIRGCNAALWSRSRRRGGRCRRRRRRSWRRWGRRRRCRSATACRCVREVWGEKERERGVRQACVRFKKREDVAAAAATTHRTWRIATRTGTSPARRQRTTSGQRRQSGRT